ncbi:MAG: DsbA family protein [Anaerolineae bacterium]|nr:DsbA family protein [Anaerolineae bacterium]
MASSNATRRNKRRQKQTSQKKRPIGLAVIVLGVVGVVIFGIIASRGANAAPALDQSRLDYDPVLGNVDAPVTIIEYGAYGCTSCRAWHQAGIIDQILAEFPGQVRFVFRDFPVIVPAYDRMAAATAQCALDQSVDGFWQYHNLLYTASSPGNSQDQLLALGAQAGLDQQALRECVAAGTHRQTVEYDLARATALALPGTPSFLVNDERIFNATPDVLRAAVARALQG